MTSSVAGSGGGPYNADELATQRAMERLRQERSTFELRRVQNQSWFRLRIAMGVAAVAIILVAFLICVWLLADPAQSPAIKQLAATVLLVDIVGLGIAIWKVVLSPGSLPELSPVTAASPRSDPPA